MKTGDYVKFRGKVRQDVVFTVCAISSDGGEALCENAHGFKFWWPINSLKYAYKGAKQ